MFHHLPGNGQISSKTVRNTVCCRLSFGEAHAAGGDYSGKKVLIVHQQVMANAFREELKIRGASEVKVCSWFDMKPELREEDDVYLKEEDDSQNWQQTASGM